MGARLGVCCKGLDLIGTPNGKIKASPEAGILVKEIHKRGD